MGHQGQALGVSVYGLLGCPTRDKVRVYASSSAAHVHALMAKGFTTFKTAPAKKLPVCYIGTQAAVEYAAGKDVSIAIDFHGAISPAAAKPLIIDSRII